MVSGQGPDESGFSRPDGTVCVSRPVPAFENAPLCQRGGAGELVADECPFFSCGSFGWEVTVAGAGCFTSCPGSIG
jgi:hypothetical protein